MILKFHNQAATDVTDSTMIEDLYVDIEARLICQEEHCLELGSVAESCRNAVYIIYTCDSAMQNDALVPLRLAEKLLDCLNKTRQQEIWHYRYDLFLWLLLVGASAGQAQDKLATRYEDLLARVANDVKSWTNFRQGQHALHNVMQSFMYAEDWVVQRHLLPGWDELERAVLLCGSHHVDIDMGTDISLQEMLPDSSLFD